MKHLTLFLTTMTFLFSSVALAQEEDDMYFIPKKEKKTVITKPVSHTVEVVYDGVDDFPVTSTVQNSSSRDVDEYNRRGRSAASASSSDYSGTEIQEDDTELVRKSSSTSATYTLSAQSLYDLGYEEGYSQGFSDGEDLDYVFGLRLARFHGRHFYSPWYWGSVSYIYDPWHWDPWHYDPWYRPYYYGGWCSVGWGIGYWGSYWSPGWHGWHGYYPPHHHHNPGYWRPYNGPRYSTARNADYGRRRIVDRGSAQVSRDRYNRENGRATSVRRTSDGSSERRDRVTNRNTTRRITDRSSSGNRTSTTRTTTSRSGNSSSRVTDRSSSSPRSSRGSSSSRVTDRSGSSSSSSSRVSSRSSSSSSRGGGISSRGGSRSGGGSRGGRR